MPLRAIGFLMALAAGSALGQTLVCPPAATPSTHGCEAFHYHVQSYRPDTRGFVELYGINQFATQSACERARDSAMARNLAVIDFYRRVRNDQRYEPDRFGPCHCDMTTERTSPNYLSDAQRAGQLRLAADVRMRVRERLMDADVPTDSELIRGLDPAPAPAAAIGGPKFVPLPSAPAAATVTNAPSDLKMTKTADLGASTTTLDLPLVEIGTPPVAAPPGPTAAIAATPPAAPLPSATPPAAIAPADTTAPPASQERPAGDANSASAAPPPVPSAPAPATPPPSAAAAAAPKLEGAEAAAAEEPAEDAAAAFISVETDRVQKVIGASSAVTDDSLRVKVLEACSQRIQLLSNLRSLIEGSGAHSALANAAREARAEAQRLAFVSRLFGSDMPPHWAPKDARDVVVDLAAEPERVLRDAQTSAEQKRHALYAFLATASPTDEQQMWLNTLIEGLLR